MAGDGKTDARSIVYNRIKKRLTIAEITVQLAMFLFFVFAPLTQRISSFAGFYADNAFIRFFIFAGIISTAFYLVGLAFSFYGGYIIEKDFGLSNQSLRQWAVEQLKSLVVTLAIGIPLAAAFYAALLLGGSLWWAYFATVIVLVTVILVKLAPVLLFPIFYTFTPLENDAVRERIMNHVRDADISIENIFTFNLSKNTRKANAAFTGMGKTKRILLSDTLIDNFTPEEIGAVFAHEIGHYRKRHIIALTGLSIAVNYLSYFVCAVLYDLYLDLSGYMHTYTLAALPMLMLLLTVFSLLVMPVINAVSRKFEWDADRYVLEHESGETFASALEKIGEMNVADRNPHPLYECIFYSHPSIAKRIAYARTYQSQDQK